MKYLLTIALLLLGIYEQEGRINEKMDWDEIRTTNVERQFRWYLGN